jgi:hypothetical protein
MKTIRASADTALSGSATTLAADLPVSVLVGIANACPGQRINRAQLAHLAAARHTCERCGQRPAAGRIGLIWLCQQCMEVTR